MDEKNEHDEPGREHDQGFKVADKRRFTESGSAREEAAAGEEKAESRVDAEAESRINDALNDKGASTDYSSITFSSFIVSLATQALMQLGEIPPPPGVKIEIDKGASQQTIDILIMLREKTRGNLEKPENDLLEEVLYGVQMAFVRHVEVTK